MQDIRQLAEHIQTLEQDIDICARCGMCQAVCPIFHITYHEADVARGKLALLSGLATEMFEKPDTVSRLLNRCLLCGSCENICSRSVGIVEIFIRARLIIAEFQGLSHSKKIILRKLLANPERFDAILAFLAKCQHLFLKQTHDNITALKPKIISPLLQNRRILPLAPVPFHKSASSLHARIEKPALTVLFFTGCLLDKLFPNVALSTVRILTHHNVRTLIPEHQGCCGIPALSSGDKQSFQRLVEYNMDIIRREHFDYLVTACPTCTHTIKTLWPRIYTPASGDLTPGIAEISKKTTDINAFLVNILGIDLRKNPPGKTTITYHDPCHLKKTLGIFREPRVLLSQAPGYRLVEMSEPDTCCGMGGSFNLEHYDLSMDIGRKKRDRILSTGCSAVVTSCPACMIQLSDLLAQAESPVAVKHVMEVYTR